MRSLIDICKRWLGDLRNPAEKCNRIGHKLSIWRQKAYVPSEWRVVAQVTEERITCDRCNHIEQDWKELRREDYSRASWPESMWDKYYDGGCRLVTTEPFKHKTYQEKPNV